MPQKEPDPKQSGWVEGSQYHKAGSGRRDQPKCTTTPTGSWTFNVEATFSYDECSRARGLDPATSLLRYLINAAEGKVGFYPTANATNAAVSVHRYTKNGGASNISFVHPGPFKENETLRPVTRVKCDVLMETNPHDGLPMLTVAVRAGLPFPARTRAKKNRAQKESHDANR